MRYSICYIHRLHQSIWISLYQLIGLREKMPENPVFHGKLYGFRLRFSLKSTHWRYFPWLSPGTTPLTQVTCPRCLLRRLTLVTSQDMSTITSGHLLHGYGKWPFIVNYSISYEWKIVYYGLIYICIYLYIWNMTIGIWCYGIWTIIWFIWSMLYVSHRCLFPIGWFGWLINRGAWN